MYLWYASHGKSESSPGQAPEVPVPRHRPPIPASGPLISVTLTKVRAQFMRRQRLGISCLFLSASGLKLGPDLRPDDDFWFNLSPPPAPWRIIPPFRLHGRRELSHWRQSGAWSSSGQRGDILKPRRGHRRGRRHKARPFTPLRFRDGGRKASEQISTCGTFRMSHLSIALNGIRRVPHTSQSGGNHSNLQRHAAWRFFCWDLAPDRPGPVNRGPGVSGCAYCAAVTFGISVNGRMPNSG